MFRAASGAALMKCVFTGVTWPHNISYAQPLSLTWALLSFYRCQSLIVWGRSQSAAVSGPEESVPTVRPWTLDSDGCGLSPGELFISCCWPDWCCLLTQRVSANIIHTAQGSAHVFTLLQFHRKEPLAFDWGFVMWPKHCYHLKYWAFFPNTL